MGCICFLETSADAQEQIIRAKLLCSEFDLKIYRATKKTKNNYFNLQNSPTQLGKIIAKHLESDFKKGEKGTRKAET